MSNLKTRRFLLVSLEIKFCWNMSITKTKQIQFKKHYYKQFISFDAYNRTRFEA